MRGGAAEAATYATVEGCPVLFVAYDLPAPDPLIGARPIPSAFATALVLTASPAAGTASATVALASAECGEVTEMPDSELERLRADNPSGRLLPHASGAGGNRAGHHPHEHPGRPAVGHGGRPVTRLTKEEIGRLLPHGRIHVPARVSGSLGRSRPSVAIRRLIGIRANPLRCKGRLTASAGLEYAAQAMGAHVGLVDGRSPTGAQDRTISGVCGTWCSLPTGSMTCHG